MWVEPLHFLMQFRQKQWSQLTGGKGGERVEGAYVSGWELGVAMLGRRNLPRIPNLLSLSAALVTICSMHMAHCLPSLLQRGLDLLK